MGGDRGGGTKCDEAGKQGEVGGREDWRVGARRGKNVK